ncbi:hypothetical protein CC1G_13901 [Coprinopsis cinerea okayama7|uniref:Uncharacterized protein n=1 Tax=Coprinopsis cinerea (strain Okayama-7 / 130 / ATCC MYA-4618 / FGSC 9003) TaxID=240176 RepID=D6RKW9_COPC7|nr:hypothetical protein CC1G_13901 [Coprinopsis cinerea okayama7\|eukprot:XP_002911861.1 hypothetical protein CC1G_13901 [Coprinopsis cinerea okayama7\
MSSLRLRSVILGGPCRLRALPRRHHHHTPSPRINLEPSAVRALDEWIANPPTLSLSDGVTLDHLTDLYATLPTRDGTRRRYETPKDGDVLGYGHHLAFFHCKSPEHRLRADGTDEELSPPPPFSTRMWAGGKITWDNDNPLTVGVQSKTSASVLEVLKKGFDRGKPLVFVTQRINFFKKGKDKPSIVEERQHVYIPDGLRVVRKEPRVVPDIPENVDFSFQYQPSPVTLFRYSSLMFNAHHIHLDKDYTTRVEGYPERLVHGPLTATMLLETVNFHNPLVHLKEFEYRATNPMYVNRVLTINGTWIGPSKAKVWCVDDEGAVGMVGLVTTAE